MECRADARNHIPYLILLHDSMSKLMPPGQQILVQAFSLQLYQAVVLLGVHVGGADAVPRGGVYELCCREHQVGLHSL